MKTLLIILAILAFPLLAVAQEKLVTVEWDASGSGPDPVGYRVYSRLAVDAGQPANAWVLLSEVQAGTLESEMTGTFDAPVEVIITAFNDFGESASTTPLVLGKPEAPTGLRVKVIVTVETP